MLEVGGAALRALRLEGGSIGQRADALRGWRLEAKDR
jgi:hypothetical protein